MTLKLSPLFSGSFVLDFAPPKKLRQGELDPFWLAERKITIWDTFDRVYQAQGGVGDQIRATGGGPNDPYPKLMLSLKRATGRAPQNPENQRIGIDVFRFDSPEAMSQPAAETRIGHIGRSLFTTADLKNVVETQQILEAAHELFVKPKTDY